MTIDLLNEHLFLVASPEYKILSTEDRRKTGAEKPVVQPERLNGLPFIIPSADLGLYKSYETMLRMNHLQPGRTIAVNDSNTGLQLTRKGLGVQILPGSLMVLNPDISPDSLDFFRLPNMPEDRKCSLAYRRDTIKKEMIQDFLSVIYQEVIPKCVEISVINHK